MSAPPRLRLFFAIDSPPDWADWLHRTHRRLAIMHASSYRVVDPRLWHMTVLFLGEQPAPRLSEILEAGSRAAGQCPAVALRADRLGGNSRVLWLSARDVGGTLERLAARVGRKCLASGLQFEAKPLVPHVTLARLRRGAAPQTLDMTSKPPSHQVTVEELLLIQSDLGAGGPRYSTIGRWPLGASPPSGL